MVNLEADHVAAPSIPTQNSGFCWFTQGVFRVDNDLLNHPVQGFVQQVRPDVWVEDLDVELHKSLLPFEGISEDHIFS